MSFTQGKLFTKLKNAKVYSKHKKDTTKDMGNYRPITLIPTFKKITETIVLLRLTKYLTLQNQLLEDQYGFLKGTYTQRVLSL